MPIMILGVIEARKRHSPEVPERMSGITKELAEHAAVSYP